MKNFLSNKDRCLIVAEISANHGQIFQNAVSLVKKAKECGVDAVKFQAYTPDTLTINCSNRYFRIKHPEWGGQSLYDLYKRAYTPWSWFKPLKRLADKLGLGFFATAFDNSSVDFLEELNVPLHKVASFELVDLPLIEYIGHTHKPLLLSCGMASLEEIKEAVYTARRSGVKNIALLKCVSSYPASPREMNLRTIPELAKRFKCPVGLSDHSREQSIAIAAVALGARIIEKHFTLSRSVKTPDSFFSLEPEELKSLVADIRVAEVSLGRVRYGLTAEEKKSRIFRRSIFVVRDISKGEALSKENIRCIRPSNGLQPKYYKQMLGKKAARPLHRGSPLKMSDISRK